MDSSAPAGTGRRALRSTVGSYVALTKPRIIELLLVTTLPTMFVARRGVPSVALMALTLVGGALAAGGANAINMFVDRDIDAVMHRTRNRPLVTGAVKPAPALVFALVLEVAAFAELWGTVNLLSAVLAVSATLFYVFVYTLWLKRSSSSNIVIGGAAGAAPPVLGWAAVTGTVDPHALLLFLIIFTWTPPHFWALAIARRDDYAKVGIPMLPVTHGVAYTRLQIVLYTILLIVSTLLPFLSGMSGLIYLAAALVLNGRFLYFVLALNRGTRPELPMLTFKFSITYLMWLFAALILDHYFHIPG